MIYIDTETRGEIDLVRCGAYRYWMHRKSEVILIGWMDDNMDYAVWISIDELANPNQELVERIASGEPIVVHNYQFEYLAFMKHLYYELDWPENPKFLYDTAAMARAMALPAHLDTLVKCIQMCLHQPVDAKDLTGRQIMLKFCKPAKDGRWYWHDKQYQELGKYCCKDVEITRKAFHALRPLDDNEYHHFMLTETINRRGVLIDVELAETLVAMADDELKDINARINTYTGGAVASLNKVADLKRWLSDVTGMQFVTVSAFVLRETLMMEDLDPTARKVIELRLMGAKTSIAKIRTMLAAMDPEDHCIRGMLLFNGAGKTGRYSSRIVQLHNMPRAGYGVATESVIGAIKAGGAAALRLLFPNVMDELPKLIRNLIIARPGKKFVCGDFAGIEARILVWLAGDEKKLDQYRFGEDVYAATAASIGYKERQIGKTCIAGGELVLTDKGLVPIEKVTLKHKLWDGRTWVRHDGVEYRGVKEVITYDGLTATPDHDVYTEDGKIPFGEAALRQRPLIQTASGRRAIRYGESDLTACEDSVQIGPLCKDNLHPVREDKVLRFIPHTSRQDTGLQLSSQGAGRGAADTGQIEGREVSLRKPKVPTLQNLRRTGHKIWLGIHRCGNGLRTQSRRLQAWLHDRPHRQRWRLLPWQPEVCHPLRTASKHDNHTLCRDARNEGSACNSGYIISLLLSGGTLCEKNTRDNAGQVSGRASDQDVPQEQKSCQKPVYDIINAGAEHRFTVSDVLVSNCELALGYYGGVVALGDMANKFGVQLDAKEASDIVKRWREANPATVELWRKTWAAACQAMTHPNETFDVVEGLGLSYMFDTRHLWCRLPSGRLLCNPFAEAEYVEGPQGTELQIKAVSASKLPAKDATEWPKITLWPGIFVENFCSAIGADLLRWAISVLEKERKDVVLHVHDEFVCEVPDGMPIVEVSALLEVLPWWAQGLPFDVSYWEGKRYRK